MGTVNLACSRNSIKLNLWVCLCRTVWIRLIEVKSPISMAGTMETGKEEVS